MNGFYGLKRLTGNLPADAAPGLAIEHPTSEVAGLSTLRVERTLTV
jgi:hypothetical protein